MAYWWFVGLAHDKNMPIGDCDNTSSRRLAMLCVGAIAPNSNQRSETAPGHDARVKELVAFLFPADSQGSGGV